MKKFVLHNEVEKQEIKTKFGIISIENVMIEPVQLENSIVEIIMNEKNLRYVFCESILNDRKHKNMLKRFLPTDYDNIGNVRDYIDNQKSRSFYSFLAEALLGIIFRDVYNYKTTKALIDITHTLIDGHTGIDACLFDKKNKNVILGEAKFYKDFGAGMRKIIADLTEQEGFLNKMESFQRNVEVNYESNEIALRSLDKDGNAEYTMEEFLSMPLIFSGFVLHEHTGKPEKYLQNDFYDKFNISAQKIKENIEQLLKIEKNQGEYRIIFFHLPINSKTELIQKVMELANANINKIRNGV